MIDARSLGLIVAGAILAGTVFAAPAVGQASAPDSLRLIPVGRYDFEAPPTAERSLLPEGLSGISWMGGDSFLAVGDEHPCLHPITVQVDPETGRIVSARFGRPIPLLDFNGASLSDSSITKDREGIAVDATTQTVWVANEWTGADTKRPSIALHQLSDGRMTRIIDTGSYPMLKIFEKIRYNLGYESLARRPGGAESWTANEGPVTVDGPRASDSTGAIVRLQKFDDLMRPVAQYAYNVDPYLARIRSPFFLVGTDVSGLSELVALADGRLLALERTFAADSAGAVNFRDRIYLVDTAGATDVSQGDFAAGLRGRTYVPARKTLLWELNSGFTNSNFEGMALGRKLANGDQLLLLISDNDSGRSEALYSLRLVPAR